MFVPGTSVCIGVSVEQLQINVSAKELAPLVLLYDVKKIIFVPTPFFDAFASLAEVRVRKEFMFCFTFISNLCSVYLHQKRNIANAAFLFDATPHFTLQNQE